MATPSLPPFSAAASPAACPGRCRDEADPADRWRRAGQRVRICVHPDEPRLIERYFAQGELLQTRHSLPEWDIAVQTLQLLLDTAADRALPMHWRHLCVDSCWRPLAALTRLAGDDSRQRFLARLRWRLATLDLNPDASVHPGTDARPGLPG